MISDFHVHTDFSGDSATPVREQITQAICLGMTSLCITDHHDYDVNSGDIDFNLDLDAYVPAMEALKKEYESEIRLLTGIELGLQPHLHGYFDQLLSAYDFDFIIGSTHFVNGLDPYYPQFFQEREEAGAYREYFDVLLHNIKTLDQYDVVGHIDYIIRYGPNKNRFYRYETYEEILEELLKTIIARGKGIECNTAGFRQGLKQPNPHPDILKRYHQLGGEIITVGSDAHIPGDLGRDFDTARQLLLSCGYEYYTTFRQRKPVFHRL